MFSDCQNDPVRPAEVKKKQMEKIKAVQES